MSFHNLVTQLLHEGGGGVERARDADGDEADVDVVGSHSFKHTKSQMRRSHAHGHVTVDMLPSDAVIVFFSHVWIRPGTPHRCEG